ncbi:sensor histidine kinase [Desulfosporosinus lacus]|uniref:histidine kinase n=1 Tax=Desulfosporosinus lacus DSM 15449 TaxID=1121420 RepID=A0A1M6GT71_9FIRM|nr:ATP-binding protein [Desulfosporosinus lacus]SHJ13136.1 two-component system, NarL family, sensor histidine kinase ComP [Desulfosporosinus lacus DSM 15449]
MSDKMFKELTLRIANATFILACLLYTTVLFNHPYVGIVLENIEGEWKVTFSDPHGESYRSGVRVGDTVIAIDNVDPGAHPSTQKWGEAEGATMLTVKRPGEPLKVVRMVKQPFASVLLSGLPMITLGFVFWIVGLVTVFKRPFLVQARALFWLNWLVGLAIIIAPASSRGLIWARELELISFSLVPVLLVKFISVFSSVYPKWNRLIIRVLYLIATLVFTLLALKIFGVDFTVGLIRKLALSNGLIGTVTVLWYLIVLIKLPSDKPEKNQVALLLAGLAMGLLPFLILTAIPILLNVNPLIDPQVSALFVVIIPITLSYVVVNKSLPDGGEFLELIISSFFYGILTSGILIFYLRAIGIVKRITIETYLSLLSLTIMALVIFNLFKALLHNSVNKILDTHKDYGTKRKNDVLRENLSSMNEGIVVESFANQLGLEEAFVIAEDSEGWYTKSAIGQYLDNTSDQEIMEEYYRRAKYTGHSIETFSSDFPAEMYIAYISNDFTCSIFFGHRSSPVVFESKEIPLLTSMCYQIGQRLKANHIILQLARESKVLEKKTRESQRRSQGLEVINRLLFSNMEEEKKVLARELHDGSLQISLDLNRRMKELITGFATEDNNFHTAVLMQEMIEDLNYELRSICSNLRPSSLRDLGLIPAVEVLFQQVMQKELLVISLEIIGMRREQRLSENIEVVAFRLLQEGINNVVKHSGSSKAIVSIALEDERIELIISDSGKGFDPQMIEDWSLTGNHFGIIGMKERIESLGGEVYITSKIGQGTRIRASIPI